MALIFADITYYHPHDCALYFLILEICKLVLIYSFSLCIRPTQKLKIYKEIWMHKSYHLKNNELINWGIMK